MDEPQRDAPDAAHEHARWLHDMRNAVSTAGVAVALSRRLLGRGDSAAAAEMLDAAGEAWDQCRRLLASAGTDPDPAERQAGALRIRPRAEAAPAPPAPPPRR